MRLDTLLPDLPGCLVEQVSHTEETIVITGLCDYFERLLPRLPTGLVSVSQHVHSFTKDPAVERTTSSSAASGAQVPLF